MKKIALFLLLAAVLPVRGQIQAVLRVVEAHNAGLSAARHSAEAGKMEAKTANNLSDPEITYDYLWGSPSGNMQEVNATQSFDFPSMYARRGQLSDTLARQYDAEWNALRTSTLLEAQTTCIEIVALRMEQQVLERTARNDSLLAAAYSKKLDAGDGTMPELNRARIAAARSSREARLGLSRIAAQYAVLSRLASGAPVSFADREFTPAAPLPPIEGMLARYNRADPSIAAMESRFEAARLQSKVAKASSLPKLLVGYRGEFSGPEKLNGIKAGISVPIFANKSNVKRAQANELAAMNESRDLKITIGARLQQLYDYAAATMDCIDAHRGIVSTASNTEMLSRALEAGQISLLEYLDGVASYNELELSLIGLEKEYRLCVAEILKLDL